MGGAAHRPGIAERRPGPKPPRGLPVVVVAGPTASGKSGLALGLARAFDGVVINADSLQVYSELSVLTARPGPAALAQAPHRLYGVLSVAERCSAARWRNMAQSEIAATRLGGCLPVLVGGTGLYLTALMHGLAPVPEVPAEVRRKAAALLVALGPAGLHRELARRDPAMAGRLEAADRQRVLRAWEVIEATGRSLAYWQRAPAEPSGYPYLCFLLTPPRPALYAACDARFRRMMRDGALDEARAISALRLDPTLPAMKALGLRELLEYLAGRLDLAEAVAAAQQATRRYAKRQLTWFRHRLTNAVVLADSAGNEQDSERLEERIFPIIRSLLLTN